MNGVIEYDKVTWMFPFEQSESFLLEKAFVLEKPHNSCNGHLLNVMFEAH